MTPQDANHFYSSGLTVVYVGGNRHFLTLWNSSANWPSHPAPDANSITLSLYNASGTLVQDIATYTDPRNTDGNSGNDVTMYPQCVKLDPTGSTIWISYTSDDSTWNVSDWFCTIPWDDSLAIYPVSMTRESFEVKGNWEMEWSTDSATTGLGGSQFVSALVGSPSNLHQGIFLYQGTGLQLVIDVDGPSSGFAFDNSGNLWLADVDYSTPKIYMWTAAQLRTAVNTPSVLYKTDATVGFATPHNGVGNDVERDGSGDLYFTINGGSIYYGELARVNNNGSAPWPSSAAVISQTIAYYDWQRSLAYDGIGSLAMGQGKLFLDMDQTYQGSTPPTVVEISSTVTPAAVPTLSGTMMVVLAFLLIGSAVFVMGRNQSPLSGE
jgi:hypothetical protein